MATKLSKLVAYAKAKQPKKSHVPLTTWSYVVMSQTKNKIFFLQITYGYRKLCRGLTYGEAKPIMKSHNFDDVITKDRVSNWKFNISSSTKSIPPDLAGRWLMVTGSHPWATCLFAVLRDHTKNLQCNISSSARPMAS